MTQSCRSCTHQGEVFFTIFLPMYDYMFNLKVLIIYSISWYILLINWCSTLHSNDQCCHRNAGVWPALVCLLCSLWMKGIISFVHPLNALLLDCEKMSWRICTTNFPPLLTTICFFYFHFCHVNAYDCVYEYCRTWTEWSTTGHTCWLGMVLE